MLRCILQVRRDWFKKCLMFVFARAKVSKIDLSIPAEYLGDSKTAGNHMTSYSIRYSIHCPDKAAFNAWLKTNVIFRSHVVFLNRHFKPC